MLKKRSLKVDNNVLEVSNFPLFTKFKDFNIYFFSLQFT